MAQSHPPTLLTHARRVLSSGAEARRGRTLLLAVSGGRDSMALLHVLSILRAEFRFDIAAHGVDHGLRAEARAELDRAEAFSAELGILFQRSEIQIEPGGNLQARARDGRYAALRQAAEQCGADWLATAHHADDRAETVLIRLLRGSSLAGLFVLPGESSGETGPAGLPTVRPLITARRADIDAHVARHRIPFSDDPSNQQSRYLRTRVRGELIPMLEDLSPGIVGHLTQLADQAEPDSVRGACAELFSRLGLGRAQGLELAQILERPRGGERLRLPGGLELVVERPKKPARDLRQGPNPSKRWGIARSGGAKSAKSG